jgi:hypothetical protein
MDKRGYSCWNKPKTVNVNKHQNSHKRIFVSVKREANVKTRGSRTTVLITTIESKFKRLQHLVSTYCLRFAASGKTI